MSTISSSNATLMLGVANLYNVPIQIQGWAADDAFTLEDVEVAETMMGVDGHLAAGYTPYAVPLELTLMADSVSNDIFDALIQAEAVTRDKYELNATIILPSIKFVYAFTRGFLKKASVMATGKKILQPRKFLMEFEKLTRAPV